MRHIVFALSLSLLASIPGSAQLLDQPIQEATVRRRPPATAIASNIRVDVNMALVPVTVLDSHGRTVTGLQPDNFRVFEGSKQVPIVTFGQQDQPISVGLIYDCSRSMMDKYKTAREAPSALFQQLNADDESFLVTVSDHAELKMGLTSALNDVQNALLFTHPNGTTSLIDGIYLGLQQIKKSHNPRKALVVVTDGGDNNSRYTLRELQDIAVESDTQIFGIGLFDHPQSREELDGPELMNRLCGATGGVNFIIRNLTELRAAMEKIGVTLHNQYVIGYYPPDGAADGKYRKIKVQLMVPSGLPPLQIYAKTGYYAPGR